MGFFLASVKVLDALLRQGRYDGARHYGSERGEQYQACSVKHHIYPDN
jgi:hypothetical protein